MKANSQKQRCLALHYDYNPLRKNKRKHCLFDETINVKKSLISLCGGRLNMIYRNKNAKLKLARKF